MMNALKAMLGALALVIGLSLSQAEAAPAASGLAPIKSASAAGSAVEAIHYTRRCWWSHGHRHCRRVWVAPRVYSYGLVTPRYGYHRPYYRHHGHYRHHHHRRHHRH